MKRGADTFSFNGARLKANGFNPNVGHNLTDLGAYMVGSSRPGSVLATTGASVSMLAAVVAALCVAGVVGSSVVLKKND